MEVLERERGADWIIELIYEKTHAGHPDRSWDAPTLEWQIAADEQWVVRVVELGCCREVSRGCDEDGERAAYAELRDTYMVRDSAPLPQEDV